MALDVLVSVLFCNTAFGISSEMANQIPSASNYKVPQSFVLEKADIKRFKSLPMDRVFCDDRLPFNKRKSGRA